MEGRGRGEREGGGEGKRRERGRRGGEEERERGGGEGKRRERGEEREGGGNHKLYSNATEGTEIVERREGEGFSCSVPPQQAKVSHEAVH